MDRTISNGPSFIILYRLGAIINFESDCKMLSPCISFKFQGLQFAIEMILTLFAVVSYKNIFTYLRGVSGVGKRKNFIVPYW